MITVCVTLKHPAACSPAHDGAESAADEEDLHHGVLDSGRVAVQPELRGEEGSPGHVPGKVEPFLQGAAADRGLVDVRLRGV